MADEQKAPAIDWIKAEGARLKAAREQADQGIEDVDNGLFKMLDCLDEAIDARRKMIDAILGGLESSGQIPESESLKDDLDLASARLKEAQTRTAVQAAALKDNPGNFEIRDALLKALAAFKEAQNDQIAALTALRALQSRNI